MPQAPKVHREKRRQRPQKRQDSRRQAAERGYGWRWSKLAERHKKANPLCAKCKEKGFVVAVEITDHIIPVHVRPDLLYEWSNLQSLCRACHTVKTNEDVRKYGAAR